MKYISYLFLIIVLILLQIVLSDLLEIKDIRPDFLILVVVWIAFREGRLPGTLVGFGLGLWQDLLETSFLGLSALAKSMTGFIAGKLFRKEMNLKYWLLLNLAVNSLIHEMIYFSIYFLGAEIGWFKILFRHAIPGAVYTWIMGLIVYNLLPKRYWIN